MFALFGSSNQTYEVPGVARVRLPKGWSLRDIEQRDGWTAVKVVRSETLWFGAGDPREVEGWMVLSPTPAALEGGMTWGFGSVQQNTRRFDEFGNLKDGSRTTWISEGNYQIHSLHDPHKVTFLRSIDPARNAALVLRVYTKKVPHERLRRIEREFFGSLEVLQK